MTDTKQDAKQSEPDPMFRVGGNALWQAMSFPAYNALKATRGSDMTNYAEGGLAYMKFRRDNPLTPTPAMRLGTAVHALMEGVFSSQYLVLDAKIKSARTKAYKEAVADAESQGLTAILRDEFELAERGATALRDDPHVRELLDHGRVLKEPSLVTRVNGVMVKIRPDAFVVPDDDLEAMVSINWKTTSTINGWANWERTYSRYGFHSGGLYGNVYLQEFARPVVQVYPVVCCTTDAPPLVKVVKVTEMTEHNAILWASDVLNEIAQAERTGDWSTPSVVVEV